MTDLVTLNAGDDKTLEIVVLDEAGSQVDISEVTEIVWLLAASVSSETSIIQKTLSNADIVLIASPGRFDVTLDVLDTADLSGLYYHEARVTFADGRSSTVVAGSVLVYPTVLLNEAVS